MPAKNTAPNNFRAARRAVRVSQAAAAAIVGVSRQSISALEKGQREPRGRELLRLASLYRVRPESLLTPSRHRPHQPRLPSHLQLRAEQKAKISWSDARELLELEQWLTTWPKCRRAQTKPCGGFLSQCADALRKAVGQESTAHFDPFKALYDQEVLLIFTALDSIAGAITWSDTRHACAVLVSSEQHEDRLRFTAAHELAHLALGHDGRRAQHFDYFGASRTREDKDADALAAELLMPIEALRRSAEVHYDNSQTLEEALLRIARDFRVSYAAMVVRFATLGELSWDQARRMRAVKPTKLARELNLPALGSQPFDAPDVVQRVAERLVDIGTLPMSWGDDFDSGARHLRWLQSECMREYVQHVALDKRKDSVNDVYQSVARWVAENQPLA